jgi:hypothetical protein
MDFSSLIVADISMEGSGLSGWGNEEGPALGKDIDKQV